MRDGLPEVTSDAEILACTECRAYGDDHPTVAVGAIKLIHRCVHLSTYEHKTKGKKR